MHLACIHPSPPEAAEEAVEEAVNLKEELPEARRLPKSRHHKTSAKLRKETLQPLVSPPSPSKYVLE